MSKKSKKNKLKNLDAAVKQCHITAPKKESPAEIILEENIDRTLLSMWPKLKMRVPAVILHKLDEFQKHVNNIEKLGIKFKIRYIRSSCIIFICEGFNDHKSLLQYLDKNKLPFHTFGHPSKRKMKVVIKGLPKDVDLNKLKQSLKSVDIPIIRVHKMFMKDIPKERNNPVLAVVPFDEFGKKILRVKQILGYDVKMEPPHAKIQQCYRCQKWGHSQRYCHGPVKCVKCAREHLSKKCSRHADDGPPKCVNCDGAHTASYRQCPACPESSEYQKWVILKKAFKSTSLDYDQENNIWVLDGEEFNIKSFKQ